MSTETLEPSNKYDKLKGFSFMSVFAMISNKRIDAKNREDADDFAKFDSLFRAMADAADVQVKVYQDAKRGKHFTITPKKS